MKDPLKWWGEKRISAIKIGGLPKGTVLRSPKGFTLPARRSLAEVGRAPKGFTLIELLVVIAIIAILSVVVILTLNPAELLRQSRDSNRISDLSVLKSAIAFYLASVTTPFIGTSTICNYSAGTTPTPQANCVSFFPTDTSSTTSTVRTVDGLGWIKINFNAITAGGSPIGQLPVDPLNTGQNFYAYTASSTGLVFKMASAMESLKYSASGTNDVASKDGGSSSTMYEQGTNLSL